MRLPPLIRIPETPTVLATTEADGSVRCGVCAHRCLVRPGRHGICGVRGNRDGTLWCQAYGAVVAASVDPIEKKPLFHVDPGSLAFSVATAGCPFHCDFCQNWEIAQGPRLGLDIPARPLAPARLVEEALASGASSIAYTYVEPTVFLEYALETGRLARQAGLRNLFITDGYATPEAIDLLAPVLDAANVDLKSFDDRFYRRLCGAHAGARARGDRGVRPGRRLAGAHDARDPRPQRLGRRAPGHRGLDRGNPRAARPMAHLTVPSGAPDARRAADAVATLRRAADIGREAGLHHVYVGNAPELHLEDTACAGCGLLLVERRGYRSRVRPRSRRRVPRVRPPARGTMARGGPDSREATP